MTKEGEVEAGTQEPEVVGGTSEEAGTTTETPEGGTSGSETPEPVDDVNAELERLRAAHKQSLGEKEKLEELKRENEELKRKNAAPGNATDSGSDYNAQRLRAQEELTARVRVAAERGDPVAEAQLQMQEQLLEDRQYAMIPEDERDEVRAFHAVNRHRVGDPIAARFALKGWKLEQAAKTAPAPAPAPTPKPRAPQPKPLPIETGGTNTGGSSSDQEPMALSVYLKRVQGGDIDLRNRKDKGQIKINYSA